MRKRIINLLLLSTLFFLEYNCQLIACNVFENGSASIETRVENCELVVEGLILGQNSFWNEDQTLIFTASQVLVHKIFKGDLNIETNNNDNIREIITIITEGGQLENLRYENSIASTFNVKEYGIFFLDHLEFYLSDDIEGKAAVPSNNQNSFVKFDANLERGTDQYRSYQNIKEELYLTISETVGANYEIINVLRTKEEQNLSLKAFDQTNYPSISCFFPTVISAGTGSILSIEGDNFGAYDGGQFSGGNCGIKLYLEGSGRNYIRSEYIVSWTNSKVEVMIPSNAFTSYVEITNDTGKTTMLPQKLEINFAISNKSFWNGTANDFNPNPKKVLVGNNILNGYDFLISSGASNNGRSLYGDSNAKESFLNALFTAQEKMGVNYRFLGTTNIDRVAIDGKSVVMFQNDSHNFSSPATLAYTGTWAEYCESTGAWELLEADIVFRKSPYCNNFDCFWHYSTSTDDSVPPSYNQNGPNYYDFETVALHEIGHASLLAHTGNVYNLYQNDITLTTDESRPIMFPSFSISKVRRTPRACSDLKSAAYINEQSENYASVCGDATRVPYQTSAYFSEYGTALCLDPIEQCISPVCNMQNVYNISEDIDSGVYAYFQNVNHSIEFINNYSEISNGAKVDYKASNYISFKPGFQASSGSEVHAKIEANCIGFISDNRLISQEENEPEDVVSKLIVYPNPVRNQATVQFYLKNKSSVTIELFSLQGKKLMTVVQNETLEEGEQSFSFGVDHLAAGTYICNVFTWEGALGKRLVVQ